MCYICTNASLWIVFSLALYSAFYVQCTMSVNVNLILLFFDQRPPCGVISGAERFLCLPSSILLRLRWNRSFLLIILPVFFQRFTEFVPPRTHEAAEEALKTSFACPPRCCYRSFAVGARLQQYRSIFCRCPFHPVMVFALLLILRKSSGNSSANCSFYPGAPEQSCKRRSFCRWFAD